jgi:hypothetical protein
VKRILTILAVVALAPTAPLLAQVAAGEASLNLSGTISAGYTNDNSNNSGSDHSISGAGSADLSGSYFNPNFLSFDIQPFYNQSRVNSTFQSFTAASGVNASAKIFGGSHCPGSITYSTSFNSSGNLNIPGLANFTTHGNNDVFAVTWGVHTDHLPSLDLSFANADNDYTVYGANTKGSLHSETFTASSAYKIAGFNMNGGYQHNDTHALTPEILADELPQYTNAGANSFSFGVGHNLPWNGSFSAAAARLDISTNYGDTTTTNNYNTSVDTLTGAVNFAPRLHLNLGATTYYTDNLEGTLYNTLLTSGVTVAQNEGQETSHDLSMTGYANYGILAEHLNLHAFAERQQQDFAGLSLASDSYSGTATYSNKLLGGSFNGVLGLTRTSINTAQDSLLGLSASVNYTHQIERWNVAGGLGYSQDAQTILIAYTTSGYNYTGSLGRRIRRRSYWGAYVSGAKSQLSNQPGSTTSSHSYTTSLSMSRFSINGTYSDSSGNALLTPSGLVSTPIPLPAVNPAAVVLYNGKAWSAGLGASPIRHLTMSATFAKALSGTQSGSTNSNNNSQNLNILVTYNFRKLSFISGYSRLDQGFSASGTSPAMVGSFYVGISRWFNFF